MQGASQSVLVYVLMMSAIGPTLAAWMFADTLDWSPWILLLVVGAVASVILWRRLGQPSDRIQYVLMALPLWLLAAGLFANAFLDGSPAERHESEVLRRAHAAKGPGSIVLRGFRAGSGELAINANSPLVARIGEGDRVTIVVRRGLFGWPRIAAIERRP